MKKIKIVNLTQHQPTVEQIASGVETLDEKQEIIKKLLTFNELPVDKEELKERAIRLANIAKEEGVYEYAMIGGAPYLMSYLEKSLKNLGIQPLYSFSKREVIEKKQDNGEIQKISFFKHIGWIEV